MNIGNLVQNYMTEELVSQLSQRLGGTDRRSTAIATSSVLSTLLGALARNASTPDGARSLNNALERDHSGSILDDLLGNLTNVQQQPPQTNNRTLNGAGILEHILGMQRGNVVDRVSQVSGMDKNKVGSLLVMLAPVVMGMLGRAKQQQDLGPSGLGGVLLDYMQGQSKQQRRPEVSMLESFIDRDGDGNITKEVAELGMSMLGGLFRR